MRKTFSSLLLVLVAAAPMFGLAAPSAQAASVNTAIRGQSALTVYWYANDGKRYTFPNANTYFSWFPSFDSVINLTDAELANIPLGNQNVTYRPGAKLVKIVSDPKVYAVSRGGILRHVTSESVASQLYGQAWNLNVHDVPVEFFTNYNVGSPIYSVSDYSVSSEYNGVGNPADSFRNIVNGSQNSALNLTADRTSINPGQAVNLAASIPAGYSGGYVRIFDLRNGTQIATCTAFSYASTCNQTVYPQRINTGDTQVQYEVRLHDSNGNRISTAYGPVIYFSTTSGSGATFTGSRFITTVNRTTANSGDSVTLTAQLTNQNGLTSNYRIEIQDPRNNTALHNCWNTSYCQISTNISLPSGQSSVNFRARLFDAGGAMIADEIFPLISLSSSGTGTLSFTSDRTNITSGQAVYLSASYNANIPSGGRIEIKEIRTGNLAKACYDSSSCSVTVYPTQASGYTSTQYVANVLNSSGSLLVSMNGPVIYFDGSSQNGTLTLNADRTSITSGQAVTLNANYNNSLNGGRIEIKEVRTNTIAKTCYDTTSCSVTVYPYQNGYTSTQYIATVYNSSGSQIATQYSQTIYFNGSSTGSAYLSAFVNKTNIASGEEVMVTANASNVSEPVSQIRMELYTMWTMALLETCYDSLNCTFNERAYNRASDGGFDIFFVKLMTDDGRELARSELPRFVFNGTSDNGNYQNDGTNYINGLTLQADRTNINRGDSVTLTANAYNVGNWSYIGNRIEIRDVRNSNNIVRTCNDQSWCTVTLPVYGVDGIAQYEARIWDRNGRLVMSQFGPVINVAGSNGSNGSNNNTGSTLTGTTDIYVSPSSNLRPNNTVYVTASILNPSTAVQNMIIRVYTESNGLLGTCNGTTVCSLPFYIGSNGVNTRTYAQFSATDRSNTVETARVNLIAN